MSSSSRTSHKDGPNSKLHNAALETTLEILDGLGLGEAVQSISQSTEVKSGRISDSRLPRASNAGEQHEANVLHLEKEFVSYLTRLSALTQQEIEAEADLAGMEKVMKILQTEALASEALRMALRESEANNDDLTAKVQSLQESLDALNAKQNLSEAVVLSSAATEKM